MIRRRDLAVVIACLTASVVVSQLGLWFGRAFVPVGAGYPTPPAITRDLFRFDATYYLDIATNGYAYSGNPFTSPNIVFAPAFPLLVRALPGVDPVDAGFGLNFVMLAAAIFLLWRVLEAEFGAPTAMSATLAQVTSEGSFAFHAYYSESTMLFFLSAALFARQRGRWGAMALAALVLGAARLTAGPIVILIAIDLWRRAWRGEIRLIRGVALAGLSVSGLAGYLTYIAYRFGNPLVLLPQIQAASWALFHPPTAWWKVLTGTYLVEHVAASLTHPVDLRTINLVWMLLGLVGAALIWRGPGSRFFRAVFTVYALFVYAGDVSSEFVISAPRFFALMTPIFVVGARGCLALPRVPAVMVGFTLLILNAGLAIWHAGCFNQGQWFFF